MIVHAEQGARKGENLAEGCKDRGVDDSCGRDEEGCGNQHYSECHLKRGYDDLMSFH